MREREKQEVPGQKFWKTRTGSKEKILWIFFLLLVQWGKLQVIILIEALWLNL